MKFVPVLDKGFCPAALELKKFAQRTEREGGRDFTLCLERNDGYVYRRELRILEKDCTENYFIAERILKTILWTVGGYKVYANGCDSVISRLQRAYAPGGERAFDAEFMSRVYEKPFEIVRTERKDLPPAKEQSKRAGGNFSGCRIGFDAGGSDRKVSAVIDGKAVFSTETVWHPKVNSDPQYHFDGILESMKLAASKMPTVDAIGVSSAGIYVNNRIMAASLFLQVDREQFDARVKNMYIECGKYFSKLYGKDIPLEVANDGDVTALAGGMELGCGRVLGIAMGTSEAGGYIDADKNLRGWLSELAFVPADFSQNGAHDEWSGDIGCGVKYFSQDAVIKLAPAAGIELDPSLTPAEKLSVVQELHQSGDARADKIFETIGIYLGYTLAYYAMFYDIGHVLVLGRVTSGKGGILISETARKVLAAEFPELDIAIVLPDESNRRVGQSIAAAGLPSAD